MSWITDALANLTPAPLSAWCYACAAITPLVASGRVRITNGVSLREGKCAQCGESTWRVGGGREE